MKTRRQILRELALAVPLFAAWKTGALASVGLAALDGWASDVAALNKALAAGDIGLLDWQGRIAALNASVPVGDISRYLEIDTLTRHFTYPARLAENHRSACSEGGVRRWRREVVVHARLCDARGRGPSFRMRTTTWCRRILSCTAAFTPCRSISQSGSLLPKRNS